MTQSRIWYVVIDSKADGPHTRDEIQGFLESGKLGYSDLAFKPGLSKWMPLAQCGEFERRSDDPAGLSESTAKGIVIPEAAESEDKGWITLTKQKNSEGKNYYIQSGPHATEQVRKKLEKGELQYTDHIWFKGYKTWQVIGSISDFDRRNEHIPTSAGAPKLAADSDPKVAENDLTKSNLVKNDLGKDLTKNNLAQNDLAKSALAQNDSPKDDLAQNDLDRYLAPPLKKANHKKILIASVGASLGIALTYAALNVYKEGSEVPRKTASVKGNVPPAVPTSPEPPSRVTAQAVNPEFENRLPKKASVLKIVTLKTDSERPQVVLETDLPGGAEINVQVSARAGSILKYPSFDLTKKITVVEGQLPSVDFSKDLLPWGDYTLKVSSGELAVVAPFSIGERNPDFEKRLQLFQKQVATQRKKEKMGLSDGFSFVSKSYGTFAKQYRKIQSRPTSEAKKKWTILIRSWRKDFDRQSSILRRVTSQNRNYFVYPDPLLKLKEIEQQLWDVTQLYDKSLKTGRSIASVEDMDQTFQSNLGELKKILKAIK